MYFLLNQVYQYGQILLFMLTNMICILIRQEKIKKLLDVFGNASRSFSKCVKANYIVSLNCRWAFSASLLLNRRKGISFLLPEQKKRNKDELLRTMSEKNSPAALFCLLRHFSALNKKNSLRSNSFLFLTLRKAPPLPAKK